VILLALEDTLKQNSKIVIWVIHIATALFIYGDGVILSYKTNDAMIFIGLGISLYTFTMLHKEIIDLQSRPPDVKYVERPLPSPKYRGEPHEPFDLNFK